MTSGFIFILCCCRGGGQAQPAPAPPLPGPPGLGGSPPSNRLLGEGLSVGSLRVSERLRAPVCAGCLSLPLYRPHPQRSPRSPHRQQAFPCCYCPALPLGREQAHFCPLRSCGGAEAPRASCLSWPSPTARSLHAVNTAAWSYFYIEVPEVWLLN